MYRFVGQRPQAARFLTRAHITSMPFIRAVQEVAVGPILKSELNKAATLVIDAYRASVPRSSVSGKHLADSLGKRVRIFRDDSGAYVVIGEKVVAGRTMVKHFHAQEQGTTIRFRKKIGGKYAWMEKVLAEGVLKYKRQTGIVIGHHYLQRAFHSQLDNMIRQVSSGLLNQVLYKWTNARGMYDRAGLSS